MFSRLLNPSFRFVLNQTPLLYSTPTYSVAVVPPVLPGSTPSEPSIAQSTVVSSAPSSQPPKTQPKNKKKPSSPPSSQPPKTQPQNKKKPPSPPSSQPPKSQPPTQIPSHIKVQPSPASSPPPPTKQMKRAASLIPDAAAPPSPPEGLPEENSPQFFAFLEHKKRDVKRALQSNRADIAGAMLRQLHHQRIPLDADLWRLQLLADGHLGRSHQLFETLSRMLQRGVPFDTPTLCAALRALSFHAAELFVPKLLAMAAQAGLDLRQNAVQVGLAEVYVQSGNRELALAAVHELLRRADQPLTQWEAALCMRVHRRFGQLRPAAELLARVRRQAPEALQNGQVAAGFQHLLANYGGQLEAEEQRRLHAALVEVLEQHVHCGVLLVGQLEELLESLVPLEMPALARRVAALFPEKGMTPRGQLALIYSHCPFADPYAFCDLISEFVERFNADLPDAALSYLGTTRFDGVTQVDDYYFILERLALEYSSSSSSSTSNLSSSSSNVSSSLLSSDFESGILFEAQPVLKYPLNINHFNLVIAASAQRREVDRAYATYREVTEQFRLTPNRATQLLLLDACRLAGNYHAAYKIADEFERAQDPALLPDQPIYELLSSIACRCHRWDLLGQTKDKMRALGFWPPSVSMYSKICFAYAARAQFDRLSETLDETIETGSRLPPHIHERFSVMVSHAIGQQQNRFDSSF